MLRRTLTAATAFTLAWPALAVAASGATVVEIGNSKLIVPTPSGFSTVPPSMSTLQDVGEFATPPENRLLALLATQDDIRASQAGARPTLRRYLLLETPREFEARTFSVSAFSQLKIVYRQGYVAAADENGIKAQSLLSARLEKLRTRLASPEIEVALRSGRYFPLDIFLDNERALGLLQLSRLVLKVGGKERRTTCATALVTTLLKGKFVFLYVNTTFTSIQDVQWAQETAATWSRHLASANPET